MEIVFIALYLATLFAYPISIYALIKWYHIRRMNDAKRSIWIPIVCMPLLACIWSYLTVVLYLGAFGPGAVVMLCSVPFTLVSLIFHFLAGRDAQKVKNDVPVVRWWVRILVVILIICMSLAPFVGIQVINTVCYKLHAKIAEPIITALHAYEADTGEYPRDLEELVPQYLETIPKPICLYLHPLFALARTAHVRQYDLEWCSMWEDGVAVGERPIISVMNVAGGFPHRYNIQTGEWSSISFLDGTCSFLD